MKAAILVLGLLTGAMASANVISVEFVECSYNRSQICARVYHDFTANVSYGNLGSGLEMPLAEIHNEELVGKIQKFLGGGVQSVATNIDGRVQTVKQAFGGKTYMQLQVDGFSTNANVPRPRGL